MDFRTAVVKTLLGEKVEVSPSTEAKNDLLKKAHAHALSQVDKKLKSGGYESADDLAKHHAQELHRAFETLGRGKKLK
jgi:hypothetical protein